MRVAVRQIYVLQISGSHVELDGDFSAGLDMTMMTCDGRCNLFIGSSSCV